MTPTARSLRLVRSQGWLVDVVEQTVTRHVKRDLFGMFDLLAIQAHGQPRFIQVTDGSHFANRIAKLQANDHLALVKTVGVVEVHGWRKLKKDGKWHCRIEVL
jgi:hypothetical protein